MAHHPSSVISASGRFRGWGCGAGKLEGARYLNKRRAKNWSQRTRFQKQSGGGVFSTQLFLFFFLTCFCCKHQLLVIFHVATSQDWVWLKYTERDVRISGGILNKAVSSSCCSHQHSLSYHKTCHCVISTPLFVVYDQLNSWSYDFQLISCPRLLTVWRWTICLRSVGGQLCCVGSAAVWKIETRQRGDGRKSHLNVWMKSAEEIQTLQAATWPGASPDPRGWKQSRNKKTEEWESLKEQEKDGVKNIYSGVNPCGIFFLLSFGWWLWKSSLETTIGSIEQHRLCVWVSELAPVQGPGWS